MMIRLTTIICALLLVNGLYAQPGAGEAQLNVIYKNGATKEPMAKQTIILEDVASGEQQSHLTNPSGSFTVVLKQGAKYNISVKIDGEMTTYDDPLDLPVQPGPYIMDYTLYSPVVSYLKTYILNIHFQTGKSELYETSFPTMDALLKELQDNPTMKIEIAGHTDNVGSDASNLTLSDSRANVVREYLLKKGVSSGRITAKGYGETQPLADNDTDEGRQKNRRTEVRVTAQ